MRILVAVPVGLTLALAACGFASEEPFSGARTGDGVAPWRDLGPAPVCLGNQFLGPVAAAPGGFCFDRSQIEAPCADDGDCRSREACVCGRCTVPYCATASDCAADRVCTFSQHRCDLACSDAGACAPGEECSNGTCRGRCATSSECQTGEVCSSRNFCVTDDCAVDGECTGSESCHVQRVPRVVAEPFAVAATDGLRVILYLEVGAEAQPTQRSIWRATSRDGVQFRFDPARPVLEDAGAAHAPSLVATATGWALYYESGDGAAIKVATSTDGVSFGAGQVVLTGGVGPAAIHAPSAVALPDGTAAVYFERGGAIELATGAVAATLTGRGVVLTPAEVTVAPGAPRAPFWDAVAALRSPHAAVTDGPGGPALRLWFSGFGRESAESQQFGMDVAIPPNYSIGYAAATVDDPAALVPWPYGPVVDRVSAFLDHRQELAPGVVQLVDDDGPAATYLLYSVEATAADPMVGPNGPFEIGRLGVLANGGTTP
ncbi:MAG: hypothetical protein IPL61_14140 [Myxococcales bacterium]|nr:hypothetical protein [Myxococcales bacterium]